jgi:hypothetical protein
LATGSIWALNGSSPLPRPPWSIDELEACFVVRDHDGQQLAYVYFEDEPGRPISRQFLVNVKLATRAAA